MKFVKEPEEAEIRISFSEPGEAWSYVGVDCLDIYANEPTMQLGRLKDARSESELRGIVLRQFGYALGLSQMHRYVDARIPWDKPAVYEALGGAPSYWSREAIDHYMFGRGLSPGNFDPDSIMMIAIPNEWPIGDYEVDLATELSASDKPLIQKIYPPLEDNGIEGGADEPPW